MITIATATETHGNCSVNWRNKPMKLRCFLENKQKYLLAMAVTRLCSIVNDQEYICILFWSERTMKTLSFSVICAAYTWKPSVNWRNKPMKLQFFLENIQKYFLAMATTRLSSIVNDQEYICILFWPKRTMKTLLFSVICAAYTWKHCASRTY